MSKNPLLDPFGRVQAVPTQALDQLERVKRLCECAACLLDGRVPSLQARLYLGAALTGWLNAEGAHVGSHERDFLRTVLPGSTNTPQYINADIEYRARLRQEEG